MRPLCLTVVVLIAACAAFAQTPSFPPAPKLNHFDVNAVDPALDPCTDFYKYACSKWQAANPIPADQAAWGVASNLQIWNETVLREALVQASQPDPKRTPVEQKIGAALKLLAAQVDLPDAVVVAAVAGLRQGARRHVGRAGTDSGLALGLARGALFRNPGQLPIPGFRSRWLVACSPATKHSFAPFHELIVGPHAPPFDLIAEPAHLLCRVPPKGPLNPAILARHPGPLQPPPQPGRELFGSFHQVRPFGKTDRQNLLQEADTRRSHLRLVEETLAAANLQFRGQQQRIQFSSGIAQLA